MNLRGKPLNHVDSGETKILYSEKAFSNSLNKLVNNLVDRRMDSYDYILDELHKKLGGKGDSMPTELKIEIKKEITSGEMKLGERYTFKQFIMTTYNVLSKYTIKGKPTS